MQFFRERPLSLMIFVMLCGFSLFSLSSLLLIIILGSILLLCSVAYIAYTLIKKEKRLFALLLFFLLLISLVLSFIYFEIVFTAEANEYEIQGEVLEIYESDYGMRFAVRTNTINSKKKNLKLIIYYNEYIELKVGDLIETTIDLIPFSTTDNGASSYYLSKGFVGSGEIISDITISRERPSFWYFLFMIKETFHNHITKQFGEDAGGLFLALIIGDQTSLDTCSVLDFTRIGITHILALSGQHLAILAFLVHKLLSFIGVNRKWRLGILCLLVCAYVVLCGFSLSVVRAAIMLILSALYFLLGKPHDIATGLFMSVFLIVLVQPYAICDLSLLLSAFATFGVIHTLIVTDEKKKRWHSLLAPLLISLVMSFFSMLYTTGLMITHFSYLSILSPITTLLFNPIMELYIYVGLVLSIISVFVSVAPISNLFYAAIHGLSHFVSSWDFGYYSSNFSACYILTILLIVALLSYVFFKFRRPKLVFMAVCVLFIGVYISAMIGTNITMNTNDVIYMNENTGDDQFLIKQNGDVAYVDVLPSTTTSAYRTCERLTHEKITKIDTYIVVGYRKSLPKTLELVMGSVRIKKILLPTPIKESEGDIFFEVLQLCEKMSVECDTFDDKEIIDFRENKIYFMQNHHTDTSQRPIFTIYDTENYHLFLAKGSLDEENIEEVRALMTGCKTLILGAKGAKGNDFYSFTKLPSSIETVVVSDETIKLDIPLFARFYENDSLYVYPDYISLSATK